MVNDIRKTKSRIRDSEMKIIYDILRYIKREVLDLFDFIIRIIKRKTYLPPLSLRNSVGCYKEFEKVGGNLFNILKTFVI
jgi:hypothetical protein